MFFSIINLLFLISIFLILINGGSLIFDIAMNMLIVILSKFHLQSFYIFSDLHTLQITEFVYFYYIFIDLVIGKCEVKIEKVIIV